MARIVFMGSPDFAVPSLEAMATAHTVVGVVTQPDRRAGRGGRLRLSPVKVRAEALDLPIYQPDSLRQADALSRLAEWAPEVMVVAAFGQILPPAVLELAPHGCLNLHASFLPRWRGASPIAAVILAGDATTGVTLMQMDEGVDTGPILAQSEGEPVHPDDTTGSLTRRLAERAADLIVASLPDYLAGDLVPRPQPQEGITHCQPLEKEDGRLDWRRPAAELARRVRAVSPWPGAFTECRGEHLKIIRAAPLPDWQGSQPAGTVVTLGGKTAVVTGQGALELVKVQRAGRKALPIEAFVCGQQDFVGTVLRGCGE